MLFYKRKKFILKKKKNKEIYEDLIYVMNNYYSEIKKVNTKLVLKY